MEKGKKKRIVAMGYIIIQREELLDIKLGLKAARYETQVFRNFIIKKCNVDQIGSRRDEFNNT